MPRSPANEVAVLQLVCRYAHLTDFGAVPLVVAMSVYRDRLRRVGGEWCFAERHVESSTSTSRDSLAPAAARAGRA